ncbi:MAG: NYN domain-containing protein [Acidobacteria bacterium]|nr:NYN domain-containing protein [Acidobacteriota bacterium]
MDVQDWVFADLGQKVDVQDSALYAFGMPYWFDGNNLIGQSAAAAAADPRPRREFLGALAAYRRAGGGRLLAFFDGDDPGRSDLPPGVAVRYAAPESADAAILRRLGEIGRPAEITVVTNDLELRTRCRRAGASTLDWREFAAKMRIRSRRPGRTQKRSEEAVDVAEWMQWFGLDGGEG